MSHMPNNPCPSCGATDTRGLRFCTACGASIPAKAAPAKPTISANRPEEASRNPWILRGSLAVLAFVAVGLLGFLTVGGGFGGGEVVSVGSPESPRGNTEAIASDSQAARADFAGEWVGRATQYAPRGTTQEVDLRTSIDASGETGDHSETIKGSGGTDRCAGTIARTSYGNYDYQEQASSDCIASTRITLSRDGPDSVRFREDYTTEDGEEGRIVGVLTRASGSEGSGSGSRTSITQAQCSDNTKSWPGIGAVAGVTEVNGISCEEAAGLLEEAPAPSGSGVELPAWSCAEDGQEDEATYTLCTQAEKTIRMLYGV